MKVKMNQKYRRIKSVGIYIINEPGFQGAVGSCRGTGAAPLLGAQGDKAPLKAGFKGPQAPDGVQGQCPSWGSRGAKPP